MAILLFSAAFPVQAGILGADDTIIEKTEYGEIDWVSGIIRAKGAVEEAPGDATTNVAVKKLKILRMAKMNAMRNIIEGMKSIRVDAGSTIGNYMEGSDYIRKKMHAIVRKAKIVEKNDISDGGIEIGIELPLKGLLMETMIQNSSDVEISISGEELYTGLVVDATGLDINPALSPKIVDENGREIFGASYAKRGALLAKGLVAYSSKVSYAETDSRVADNPLIVRGLRKSGIHGTNVVISREDGAKIKNTDSNLNWLTECRVIIVID